MSDYFVFDDVDSRRFEGIYVYFDEVDTTPSRVYEEIVIPARNGALFIDGGRFDDARHTYHIIALTDEAGRSIINALASKVGYHRLEDSFHPNEFYDAVFTSDVEPRMKPTRGKSTFRITFTRKPQRFLTSGETAVTVTSGSTLANPTPFDSHPLLKLYGYGNIQINSDVITASGSALTEVELGGSGGASVELDMSMMNNGDPFYSSLDGYPSATVVFTNNRTGHMTKNFYPSMLVSATNGSANVAGNYASIQPDLGTGFVKGTSKTVATIVVAKYGRVNQSTGVVEDFTATITITTVYDGDDTITMSVSVSTTGYDDNLSYSYSYEQRGYLGISSKIILPSPAYIDLENGEAYGTIDGQTVSVNSLIVMPPELPVLKSGNNTITFDNTFTKLEVVPRWWKV